MNEDKTEFIIFTSRSAKINTDNLSLQVGQSTVTPAKVVKNLGSLWDNHLNMDKQIAAMCRSSYYHLRAISRIRDFITTDACKTLVQSYVISRLDYGNAILTGLPGYLIKRLQLVQNSAARLITRTPRTDHITDVRRSLHWLPVASRIKFKILVYVFKCLNSLAPVYLTELVKVYHPGHHSLTQSQKSTANRNRPTYEKGDRYMLEQRPSTTVSGRSLKMLARYPCAGKRLPRLGKLPFTTWQAALANTT